MKHIEFEGILSGDYEAFCFDVDGDTFKSITGEMPDCEANDESCFNPRLYRVYPSDIFGYKKKKLKIKIEFEEIEATNGHK